MLASAVNKPIILLPGSDKLNEVRLDRWRYITEVRARICAEKLIASEAEQKRVIFDLVNLAGGPPDPRVKPKLQEALEAHAPALAQRALANPMIRANALLPAARFGLREEMKQAYGLGWREHVRGVTTTLDVVENLGFHDRIAALLAKLDTQYQAKIDAGYTLDPAKARLANADRKMPDVIVVAANARGEIVRYYEAGETASYFGSPAARSPASGYYDAAREGRMIASTGKILAAIGIANAHSDRPDTLYLDRAAPAHGSLDGCDKGGGEAVRGRRAVVAFACSLNQPIEWRAAQLGQARMRRLIDRFGFNLPPAPSTAEATPPSTAAVRGLIAGSPRRVHQMAGVVLASLTEQGHRPVRLPSLVKAYDFTSREAAGNTAAAGADSIVPNRLISRSRSAPAAHAAAGAAVLRQRRRTARHPEGARRLVRRQAHGPAAALRQDRHVGRHRHQRHRRHLDRGRPAVLQWRGLLVCRADRHRLALAVLGAIAACRAGRRAAIGDAAGGPQGARQEARRSRRGAAGTAGGRQRPPPPSPRRRGASASGRIEGIKKRCWVLRVANLSHAALRSPRLGAAGVSCGSGNVM